MEQAAALTFDHMNSGHQVYLSNGTVWRASPDTAMIVRSWQSGDPVLVAERSGNAIWRFVITNEATGAHALAIPSSKLS